MQMIGKNEDYDNDKDRGKGKEKDNDGELTEICWMRNRDCGVGYKEPFFEIFMQKNHSSPLGTGSSPAIDQ